jgi:hypothetical protein
MSCGGWCNEIKVADEHVQNLVNQVKLWILRMVMFYKFTFFSKNKVKDQVEGWTGKKFGNLRATLYKTQIVAGTNYYIKVRVFQKFCLFVFKNRTLQYTQPKICSDNHKICRFFE